MTKQYSWMSCAIISVLIGAARIGPPSYAPQEFLVGAWSHPDNLSNHWLLVWVAERIAAGESILHNDQYYLPYGDYPWLAGNGTEGVLYLPFHLLLGYPTAVPIWLLMMFVAIGFAGYCLGRVLGLSSWLALVPASIVVSTPYLADELTAGRFSQFDIVWFVGAAASLLWLFRRPQVSSILLTGLFTGLTAVFYWYYGFFFVLFASLSLLVAVGFRRTIPFSSIGLAACLALLISLPVFWVYMSHWTKIPGVEDMIFPPPEARFSSLSPSWIVLHDDGQSSVLTQSLLTIALIGNAFVGIRRDRRYDYEIVLGLTLIMGFGVLCAGIHTPVYGWIYGAHEILQRFWWPSRHIVGVLVGVLILVSVGLRKLTQEWSLIAQFRWSVVLSLVIPLSLYLQGNRPFHAHYASVTFPPESYLALADLEEDGIVQFPISPRLCRTQAPLLFQMVHRKPMLNGHAQWVDRVRPREWDQRVQENGLLGHLWQFEEANYSGRIQIGAEDIQGIREMGVRYWVIDRELFSPELPIVFQTYIQISNQLFDKPLIATDTALIYDLDSWTGEQEIDLPAWDWPTTVQAGTGTIPLRAELFDSVVLQEKHKNIFR